MKSMVKQPPTWYTPIHLKRYLLLFLGFWAAMLAGSMYWNLHHEILDEKFLEQHEGVFIVCSHTIALLLGVFAMGLVYYAIKKQIDARRQAYELYAWLSAIVESNSDAIFGLSPSLRIESTNRAAQSLLGYSGREMNGRSVELILAPETREEVVRRIRDTQAGKLSVNQEMVLVRKDGLPITVAMTISSLGQVDGKSMGFSIIARDITEQKATESRLRQAEKMEAIAIFSAGLAHNFRNLLNSIMGHAQILQMQSADNRELCKHTQRITDGVKRSMELITALLNFTRKDERRTAAIDMHEIIRNALLLAEGLAGWQRVKLVTELRAEKHMVQGSKSQVEHVLLNLFSNALDAMEKSGKIIVRTENMVVDEAFRHAHGRRWLPGKYLLMTVSDTGHGMDRSTASRVFEPFYTTKRKGTGLGLATVQQTIANMNGQILVESEPGKGTSFRIYLPV